MLQDLFRAFWKLNTNGRKVLLNVAKDMCGRKKFCNEYEYTTQEFYADADRACAMTGGKPA